MKSLSELADIYDGWATANEATAEEILTRLDSLPDDVRERQRWRANQVMAEAAALKKRAAEIRKLEGGISEELHAVSGTPDDPYQGRNRPRTIWRYNHFR